MFVPSGVQVSRVVLRFAAAGFAAAMLAGCSADASRLSDPFGNPFGGNSAPTGSIAPVRAAKVARVAPVASRPLPAPSAPSRPFLSAAPAASPRAAYNAPATSDVTGTIARRAVSPNAAGWSPDGGTPIVAAQGETAAMLSRRYGVPEDALLRANGFGTAAQIQPGTRLIIPVYNAAGGAAAQARREPPVAAPAPAPAQHAAKVAPHAARAQLAKAKPPVEDSEDAPAKPAHILKAPAKAKLAAVKPAAQDDGKDEAPAKPAAKLAPPAKPQKLAAVEAKPVKPAPQKPQAAPAKVEKVQPVKTAKLEPAPVETPAKRVVDPQPTASLPPAAAASAVADSANPEFRWPARGRIIQGFKSGGNDGINIAVPEGTSVKAAEGGVVAYAGSELKGYGNLVLIRHPNGFVSAYANNGEIDVKRGDAVKRGQTIAKSGQTGNVASPQLHFELRKGSTPVDPTNYLAGL